MAGRVHAHVLPPGGGREFGPGIRAKVELGQSPDFAVIESQLPPNWDGPPPHVHGSYDEAFHVVEGAVVFTVDGSVHECTAGSFVYVPRGLVHGFANPGGETARILVIATPGAIGLVEEIYALPGGLAAPDPVAMRELCARHDSEIRIRERTP